MPKYFLVLLCVGLSACGMKGSLELPPGPPPEPLLGNRKPAPKPAPKPAADQPADSDTKDVSTDKNTRSQ